MKASPGITRKRKGQVSSSWTENCMFAGGFVNLVVIVEDLGTKGAKVV